MRARSTPHPPTSDATARPAAGDAASVPTAPQNQAAEANRIVRALPADEYARLLPHLERITLEVMQVLAEAGGPLDHAYFPEGSIVSVVRPVDGTVVEAGTIGREGMVGIEVLLGAMWSPSKLTGQVPGPCARVPFDLMRQLLPELPGLRALLGRYTLAFLDQVGQTAVCNARHPLERRCARWLLMTQDRTQGAGSDGGGTFLVTHDVLAQMLGVRRAGVSVAAGALQDAGLIRYRRGRIRVLDRAGLEAAACECYAINRDHFERLLTGGAPPAG